MVASRPVSNYAHSNYDSTDKVINVDVEELSNADEEKGKVFAPESLERRAPNYRLRHSPTETKIDRKRSMGSLRVGA